MIIVSAPLQKRRILASGHLHMKRCVCVCVVVVVVVAHRGRGGEGGEKEHVGGCPHPCMGLGVKDHASGLNNDARAACPPPPTLQPHNPPFSPSPPAYDAHALAVTVELEYRQYLVPVLLPVVGDLQGEGEGDAG